MLRYRTIFGECVDKVDIAVKRLKMFVPPEGYYLAFSGGKDSIVIKKLVDLAQVKYESHYSVTTIDPPELVMFIKQYYKDVIFDKPEKSFFRFMKEKGFPTRKARWCCAVLKESGGSGRVVVTGIRNQESRQRSNRRMVEKCYKDLSKTYVNPIIDWSFDEVWEFIHLYGLPYCSLYDEGFKRIGCIMCPNSNQIRDAARWPKFDKAFRSAFKSLWSDKMIKNPSAIKQFVDSDVMYEWWKSGKGSSRRQPGQLVMFE